MKVKRHRPRSQKSGWLKYLAGAVLLFIAVIYVAPMIFTDPWMALSTLGLAAGAALSADRVTPKRQLGLLPYPVAAATKIYGGSIVAINAGGYALPAADTAGLKTVGLARKQVDNSAGLDGDLYVEVEAPIIAELDATSITQAMVGEPMYIIDDHTFDNTANNGVFAGVLVEYISSTKGKILLGPAAFANLENVTASAAELNVLDGVVAGTVTASKGVVVGASKDVDTLLIGTDQLGAAFVVGAEGSNIINVGIQLKDGKAADLAVRGAVLAYLSGDANGDSIVGTAPDGGVAIGTDGVAIPLVAGKCFLLISEADGDIDLNITESGDNSFWLVLLTPSGRLVVSPEIDFN